MGLLSRLSKLPNKFKLLFWLTQAIGIIMCGLIIVWVWYYQGGVGWRSQPRLEFNWHTLSFSIGMIYLYANGMIVFRFLPWIPLKQLKLLHTGIHTCVIVSMIFGMFTVIDCYSSVPSKCHFTSMHSWLGIVSMFIFSFNVICCTCVYGVCWWVNGPTWGFHLHSLVAWSILWILSVYIYLYPGLASNIRVTYMPLHRFLGIAMFVCTVSTALLEFDGHARVVENYLYLPPEALVLNTIAMLLLVFTSLTVYLLSNIEFKL